MRWGPYLVAMAIVVVGLVVVDNVAPRASLPLVGLILLGIAVTRPGFLAELQRLGSGQTEAR